MSKHPAVLSETCETASGSPKWFRLSDFPAHTPPDPTTPNGSDDVLAVGSDSIVVYVGVPLRDLRRLVLQRNDQQRVSVVSVCLELATRLDQQVIRIDPTGLIGMHWKLERDRL